MVETAYHHYLVIHRVNGPGAIGPFMTEQERDDFACALWFGHPARLPYAQRGERIPFNKDTEQLYYTAVNLGNARLMSFRNVTVGDLMKGKTFPKPKKKPRVASIVVAALCFAASAHAQTLTNADLGKKLHAAPASEDVYTMLKAHEYHAPLRRYGPLVVSTGATSASLGPWEWPVERVARRLDGTSIDTPPTVYGAVPNYGTIVYLQRSGYPRVTRSERGSVRR